MQWHDSKICDSRWYKIATACLLVCAPVGLISCDAPTYKETVIHITVPEAPTPKPRPQATKNDESLQEKNTAREDSEEAIHQESPDLSETEDEPIAAVEAPEEGGEDDLAREWRLLISDLRTKGLAKDDLLYLVPQSDDIQPMVENGNSEAMPKIKSARERIKTFELKPRYIWRKLERVRAKFGDRNVSGKEIRDYQQRLEAIPRLIEEDRLNIANSVLSDIYFELDDPESGN